MTTAEMIVVECTQDYHDRATCDEADTPGGWRFESQRWLATLNPGRTPEEYAKAVAYFFETPGVPQRLDELTFDLLLAYRGALAARATAHAELQPRSRAVRATPATPLLTGETTQKPLRPLAPATVNIRLTALRQFLCYCRLFGSGVPLEGDQIRAALKRLGVDRRRPYQVLHEPEWSQFLEAAAVPAPVVVPKPQRAYLWGRTRAELDELAAERQQRLDEIDASRPPLVRTSAGLTGKLTAQRDHALLSLALATGLRAIELASLDLGDLSREWRAGAEEWWLILPDEKTKGQTGGRELPLAPDLVTTLLAYVAATGRSWADPQQRSTPLFLAKPNRRRPDSMRLTPQAVRLIVDRVEQQWRLLFAGGESRQISPHSLRHSTAIALLEGNASQGRAPASVEHVRGWLGHLDIRTTQGYLAHLDGRKSRRPFALSPSGGQEEDR